MEYKNTIITPKTDFPMKAGLPNREPGMLERWQEQGFLYADNLNPQKARLLLQLALLRMHERSKVQEIFNRY